MAHTIAPEGYQSHYAALLDLIKFGPGIWSAAELLVLLFHAERASGKDSDRHSQSQATDGIRSADNTRWIRGPSGVSKGTWVSANAALVKAGVVVRTRHRNKFGKDEPSEYAINWGAVAAAVEKWKQTAVVESRPPKNKFSVEAVAEIEAETDHAVSGQELTAQVVNSQPLSGQELTAQVVNSRPPDMTRMPVVNSRPHSQSQSQSLDLEVRHSPGAREEIAFVVEQACGERIRTDRLTTTILETGQRLNLPLAVLGRWIYDFCYERRKQGYQVNAGLIGKAIGEDIISWVKKPQNRNFVEEAQRRATLAKQHESAEIAAMAPTTTPEFAEETIGDLMAARQAKGA